MGYTTKSAREIFSRNFDSRMNPHGVDMRESRDSDDHPLSLPIIVALDVTGSMGHIPHYLVREGLPNIIEGIINEGIADPQMLFMGIGDHEVDRAPLQVGQFESSDELMDQWLTSLWIESGGGGNDGESYLLAWYFASRYTHHDHLDKRGNRGLLFTVGDEPTLRNLPARAQQSIMGEGQYQDRTAQQLLEDAREKYDCYHLHVLQGHNGSRQDVKDGWEQLMGDHLIQVQNQNQVVSVIVNKVIEVARSQDTFQPASENRFDNLEI